MEEKINCDELSGYLSIFEVLTEREQMIVTTHAYECKQGCWGELKQSEKDMLAIFAATQVIELGV